MRIFVTGASGWIASAVVPELVSAGHDVVGLARSDAAAAKVVARGASVLRGDLHDVHALQAGASDSDGVVHLGYHHDFSQMAEAAALDAAAITAMGDVLAGTGNLLLISSGVLGLGGGADFVTEGDTAEESMNPRVANAKTTLAYAERGVRSCVVRFAPTVHGEGDHGFVAMLVEIARRSGVSAYIDDGANTWPAVHVLDAAALVRLAVERAPARSTLHATTEQGVPTRSIAEAIGRGLDLPVVSLSRDDAVGHFDWMAWAFGAPSAFVSNEWTRRELDWKPTHPTLLEDISAGHYFR
jgi:nucleoside-diphosphate-sugar epimerase